MRHRDGEPLPAAPRAAARDIGAGGERAGERRPQAGERSRAPLAALAARAHARLRKARAALRRARHARLRRSHGEPARQALQRDRAFAEGGPRIGGERGAPARSSRWRGAARIASPESSARALARKSARRALGDAQNRAAPARVEIGETGEKFGAHRHAEFRSGGRGRRAHVGGVIDQRPVGLMTDRGNQRNQAFRRRANDDLLVEAPQILERAAAARDDQQVGPRDRAARLQRIEAGDRRGDFRRRSLALHAHRPDQHVNGKAVRQGGAECRGSPRRSAK